MARAEAENPDLRAPDEERDAAAGELGGGARRRQWQ